MINEILLLSKPQVLLSLLLISIIFSLNFSSSRRLLFGQTNAEIAMNSTSITGGQNLTASEEGEVFIVQNTSMSAPAPVRYPGQPPHEVVFALPLRGDGKIWSGKVSFTASKPIEVEILHMYNPQQIVDEKHGEPYHADTKYPYDIVTSVKLEKGLLSSTIRFRAPGLMSSTKLGMMDSMIDGEDDQGGIIEAIPKDKAQDLLEIIRSGMQSSANRKFAPSKDQQPNELLESNEYTVPPNQKISIADEIRKLAKLKDEGIISEDEFKQMKQDLIRKDNP